MNRIKVSILCSFIFILTNWLNGQDTANSVFSESIVLDSICKPDFYKVQIVVTEYNLWQGKGRKGHYVLMNIDSVELQLKDWLANMGVKRKLNKINITIVEQGSYYGGNLATVTYEFILNSKDSVEMLTKNIRSKWLKGLKASPGMYKETIASIERSLASRAEELSKRNAMQYADKWGMKINKVSILTRSFGEPYSYQKQYNQIQVSNIELNDIIYNFTLYVSYSLK